ncbi:MAG TPA: PASTA domain-containing protein [Vicinamibacterales bacterium]
MALTQRVWGLGKLLMLAGALFATFLIFFAAAARIAIRSRDVVVPRLTGATVNAASSSLADLGLTLRVEEGRRIDPKVPEGRIVAQDPQAGAITRRPRAVKVWLSAGARAPVVPSLVGVTERSAVLRLQADGLTLLRTVDVRTGDYPVDVVVGQWPPPNVKGADVVLLVNRGERGATYVMPDVIGVDGTKAAELLRGWGFRVTVVGSYPYPGIPSGIVLRQNPRSGFQVAPGEAISLEVSR